jgi:hypothetical protein
LFSEVNPVSRDRCEGHQEVVVVWAVEAAARTATASARNILVATDFFTVEVLTLTGLITCCVLFFIHLESRRICLAALTRHPDQDWMEPMARSHVVFSGFTAYFVLKTFKPGFEAIDLATQLASRCSGPKCVLVATQLYERGNALIALGSAEISVIGELTQNAKALQSLGKPIAGL